MGDLFLWHGFLAGRMDAYLKPMPGPPGDNSARIAEVYGCLLYTSMVYASVALLIANFILTMILNSIFPMGFMR